MTILIKYRHRKYWALQFWCVDDSHDKEDKEQLIKVEAMPNFVSESTNDGYVVRVTFV